LQWRTRRWFRRVGGGRRLAHVRDVWRVGGLIGVIIVGERIVVVEERRKRVKAQFALLANRAERTAR
jgi:hypothetical protein